MRKVNLGCGTVKVKGYINVDLKESDFDLDIRQGLPWKVDKILASHLIEHFSFDEWNLIKRDWFGKLEHGGELEIYCPDMNAICKNFKGSELDFKYIYGLQTSKGEFHKNGFTKTKLVRELKHEGFKIYKSEEIDNQLHIIAIKP